MRPGVGVLGDALRRTAVAAVTVLGVALAACAALVVAPGDALLSGEAESARAVDPEREAILRRELGLDLEPHERLLRWTGAVVTLDFGRSFRTGRRVVAEIGDRLPATLELNAAALALVAALGLPLGWRLARRAGPGARAGSALLLALYAAPAFWIALLLQEFCAVRWGLFPLFGRTPAGGGGLLVRLHHLALPALCLALHGLAFYARLARETAAEGWRSRHAQAARALGVAERTVFARHARRPSLVPLAALAGLLLPSLAAGSVLIENVFAWPGLGELFVASVRARDVPVVLALTVLSGALTVAGSLAADLLLALADPRLRRPAAAP